MKSLLQKWQWTTFWVYEALQLWSVRMNSRQRKQPCNVKNGLWKTSRVYKSDIFFAFFRLSGFWCKSPKGNFYKKIQQNNCEVLDKNLDEIFNLVPAFSDQFEYWDKSKYSVKFGSFRLWTRVQKDNFFQEKLLYKLFVFNWDLVERNQAGKNRKKCLNLEMNLK